MAKVTVMQNSFSAGEWSRLMDGRTDFPKHQSALARMENFVIDPRGPAVYRPGLKYIAATKTSGSVSQLLPFEFSAETAYVLEFGDTYIRFYKDQAQIESGGSPYEIVSPYAAADLAGLKYCQSADVLYLFHPSYPPLKVSRTADTAWTATTINFRPPPTYERAVLPATTLTLSAITGTGITFTAGAAIFQNGDVGRLIVSGAGRASIVSFTSSTIVVCDVVDDFASVGPIASGSWEMQGSPVGQLLPSIDGPIGAICTLTSSEISDILVNLLGAGDNWIVSASGANEYYLDNASPFYSAVKPIKMFEDDEELIEGLVGGLGIKQWDFGDNDTLGYNTIYIRLSDETDPDTHLGDPSYVQKSTGTTTTIDLFRSTDVGKYVRIYNGFIKVTSYTSALEVKGEIRKALTVSDPDAIIATSNWTLESVMWSAANGYPSCGVFFENRLFVAGSPTFSETFWGSATGDYENFTPGTDDADAVQFTLAGRQVSIIRWLEPRDYLIIGCVGGEWRVGADDSGTAITPTNVTAKERDTTGCANTLPITVDDATLFVQREQRQIRELSYQFEVDGYKAPDLALLSEHITESGILGLTYQQNPLSIVWSYRADGKFLGMTYLRDQDVVGWHIHETDGEVESMVTIPGDGYHEVWAIVKRTVNGSDVRYVEMMEAFFTDSNATYKTNKGLNAFFVDSGKTYNDVATTTITGAGHLEGKDIVALADGSIVTGLTVFGGQFVLPFEASVVHYGLSYTGLLQTMRFDAALANGTPQGKKKRIVKMNVRVYESGIFKYGKDESTTFKASAKATGFIAGATPDLTTGDIEVQYEGEYDKNGQLMIIQDTPVPTTMLAIIPEVVIQ